MPNLRPVLLVTGVLVAALGVAMLVPMTADLLARDPAHRADWTAFATAAILSIFSGGAAAAAAWGPIRALDVRQGFLLTAASWLALVAFGAIPFVLGAFDMTYTDAFFEAMSGLTTTGSTVVSGLDDAPPGFLLWRSMLQWLGGVGVIIMAFAVLPALKIGGMQLFKMEAWDTSEKFIASAAQYSLGLSLIYIFLTALCFVLLWAFGMPSFDALNHALTTLSTGGYSTRDASVGAFLTVGRAPLDLIVTAFMIIGSLPFGILLIAVLRGEWRRLAADSQIRFFLFTIAAATATMAVYVYARFDVDAFTAFRLSAFNVVSVFTGTGYATTDYGAWGAFAVGFFFCIMFVGGCAGSTSCGLKIFRFQVALAAIRLYARRLAHPHGVFVEHYNGRPISDEVFVSVLSFFFIYFASFATLAAALSGFGLDAITALSAAGTAIANVGPGLGPVVGPAGNFASLPDAAKWLMAAGMLLGRLEFFTVLVLLMPDFWRR
ncbi:TrkH family potassium uptake protein [Amphiplicatus metriothermophilus]|uniref:Trk system potassium uptake protein n=1 Tax=Amphiplicatus metriothermophilus TaxID=1519374 RepID=A0A239PK44_9PROT|nr:TrkH family potassium uptake protein [Amphiplicatus metriothermophilus]MBB5517483.1 trk system potassium uptake protein TrkH [Amphiplicatus metriothermophilus]SNT68182.1 trk system potassium uptake protein TrkH [Amphiplicatus metriothermophilus]